MEAFRCLLTASRALPTSTRQVARASTHRLANKPAFSQLAVPAFRSQLRNERPATSAPLNAASRPFTTLSKRLKPLVERPEPSPEESEPVKREVPSYDITFTCKPCLTRSTHRISKQGYHKGTVLITCPNCKNRHVISDHLKIFKDQSTTIEDILREKGETLKKGTIGADGDIEFYSSDEAPTEEADGTPKQLA